MATSGGKAAVRLAIQKEVFTPTDERLLGLATVSKPGRKKKISYLCVSVNPQEKPPRVCINRVKHDEQRKDKQFYRKVKTWELHELKMIDGKSSDTEVPEFDLHFDKTNFKWVASNVAEKKAFIVCLYKMVHKYLPPRSKPEFVHVDEKRLQELLTTAEGGGKGRETEEEAVQQEEYQELTEKEQEDLEKLLQEEEEKSSGLSGIQNIEAFTELLSQQLSQLDEANIHTLMDSETQIHSLMESIDKTMLEIQATETKLLVYDELLAGVRGNMTKLSKDYSRIMIWDRNLKSLLSQVEDIVEKLYLDPHVERVLKNTPFTSEDNIRACTNAVKSLHNVMRQQLSQGVQIMQAVTEQNNYFSELSFSFSTRLHDHLTRHFTQESTVMLEKVTQRSTTGLPSLPSHMSIHNTLLQYTGLMGWIKDCENTRFIQISEAYCVEFRRVYDSEIKAFMADIKSQLGRAIDPKRGGGGAGGVSGMGVLSSKRSDSQADLSYRGSTFSLNSPSLRGLSTSLMDFTASSTYGSRATLNVEQPSDRPRFDQVFMLVLEQLQPVCLAEQKFCTTFFHFLKQEDKTNEDEESSQQSEEGMEETDGGFRDFFGLMAKKRDAQTIDVSIMSEGVKGFLQQLFNCLLTELESLINFGEKIDHYNSLYLLVAVTQRVIFAQEGGKLSYLDNCLASSCVVIKRLFDRLVSNKEKVIKECKVPRKGGKCGILPCVKEFTHFAEKAEKIVMGTDRRLDLDNAYKILIKALFEAINRISDEHPKTPRNVVLLENYHQVYDNLSHLKIHCLEEAREEAKQRYRTHQEQYVITCLGKPLDKLSTFFEGVERLLATGMKPEQIGFYRDYNKAELLKCIQHYPGKEVKRGLEKLYKRCKDHLSEELGRLRVIWGAMQNAFINQYEHFTKLIEKCYPGAQIHLEFTLDDIIEYFRTISED